MLIRLFIKGMWCNGSTPRSHRGNEGSIPFISIFASFRYGLAIGFLTSVGGKVLGGRELWPEKQLMLCCCRTK